jgi:hypothetical protein
LSTWCIFFGGAGGAEAEEVDADDDDDDGAATAAFGGATALGWELSEGTTNGRWLLLCWGFWGFCCACLGCCWWPFFDAAGGGAAFATVFGFVAAFAAPAPAGSPRVFIIARVSFWSDIWDRGRCPWPRFLASLFGFGWW